MEIAAYEDEGEMVTFCHRLNLLRYSLYEFIGVNLLICSAFPNSCRLKHFLSVDVFSNNIHRK